MKRLWPLFGLALLAVGLVALVGAVRSDAPPATPGQVVEDFLERVVDERYDKVETFLAEGAGAASQSIEEWRKNAEAGLGEVRDVRGETEWISGDRAEATGVLVAERRERRLRFALTRTAEGWRIASLDDFWTGDAAEATDPIRIREGWRARSRPARITDR